MDAREYMAKKGIGGGRDEERPNTLEEKAWARAREAGDHRPRAGTPYDWEDWERYHDELAEGAEEIEQKIDHEAHPALAHAEAKSAAGAGGEVTTAAATPAVPPHPAVRLAFKTLAVLLPPLAVGLSRGGPKRLMVNLLLTLLGWLPGVVHALRWLRRGSG
ncbi:YqaE/Pmp3 family membrane protein [Halomonas campisalis]|uniref:YqaE/Pmp3 family membrane protein n=1 Tax=Billgrantia campisalis TaxID=74661 RepID=A0ABS9PBW6_9GAMM|nr:YqaE/Pmp3 family membrane protein [Halomonas campisalis]MCG6659273.1 YqaE/Pmp3 family membrane protein [Halomonas campisalis]MDR5864272.1 YqaE/Pmp3 family membrane protein [Halomonas campisalis]